MGCVLHLSFGKYLLVETKDKVEADDYSERHEINWAGNDLNCTHDENDDSILNCPEDYHETGFPHTHGPDSQEDNATHQTTPEAGQDYHDTGYYHTHSPESMEEGGNDYNSSDDVGENAAISKTLEELLANIGKPKTKTGLDYHDTGFDHTHRPKGRRNNKHTRNKKRKTSKKRTPKRMRPRWSNVQ